MGLETRRHVPNGISSTVSSGCSKSPSSLDNETSNSSTAPHPFALARKNFYFCAKKPFFDDQTVTAVTRQQQFFASSSCQCRSQPHLSRPTKVGFIGRLETCFAAPHHHFLAIKICSSFHGNTRSFLKVFGGMHSLCVVFCAHISRRWAEPLCALVKLSFLILKQIPSSFFVHVFCSKISGNPTFS